MTAILRPGSLHHCAFDNNNFKCLFGPDSMHEHIWISLYCYTHYFYLGRNYNMDKKRRTSIKISSQPHDYPWKCSEMSTLGNEYTTLYAKISLIINPVPRSIFNSLFLSSLYILVILIFLCAKKCIYKVIVGV